jgi:hypothetical protein
MNVSYLRIDPPLGYEALEPVVQSKDGQALKF